MSCTVAEMSQKFFCTREDGVCGVDLAESFRAYTCINTCTALQHFHTFKLEMEIFKYKEMK